MPELDERLAPNVSLLEETEGRLRFDVAERGSVTLAPPSFDLVEALRGLSEGLTAKARASFDEQPDFDSARFEFYLLQLRRMRLLESGLRGRGGDLLTVVPHRMTPVFARKSAADGAAFRLSRFAYMHTTDRGTVLESPEASCTVVLHDPRTMLWIHSLDGGGPVQASSDPDGDERAAVLDLLWRYGFLDDAAEAESPARASWEFHDRLFHGASRPGNVLWTYGGSYRFEDRFPSPPAVKPRMPGDRLALETPDMAVVAQRSGSLLDVMQHRRSFRSMGEPSIGLPALTEFLYRVARFVDVIDREGQEVAVRVFPSGGAIHEIEFYLSVRVCDGLQPGFYHYHGYDHALDRLPEADDQANTIVRRAGEDWGQPDEPPQVVLTLASRLPRLAWKYDTVAYRATMMNAGVIVQTMYLVAQDMNLGCAPAGRGDPAVFAEATGIDPFEETSILEFGLGTRAAGVEPTMDQVRAASGRRQRGAPT